MLAMRPKRPLPNDCISLGFAWRNCEFIERPPVYTAGARLRIAVRPPCRRYVYMHHLSDAWHDIVHCRRAHGDPYADLQMFCITAYTKLLSRSACIGSS